ncbi:prefoldin [Colletotrichum higginsianum]|nr:prefoldin [Colletotrichum higginsianum]
MAAQGSESINLETLDAQQLSQVKKQLEEELEHLTNSFAQLHSAQAKFKECLRCVKARPGSQEVVSKDTESAERFYEAKVQQLLNNIQDLEIIVQRKTSNVRSVEDVLRQKVMQSQAV